MRDLDVYVGDKLVARTRIEHVGDGEIRYIAAAPIDRRYSAHGSGLPFPNYEMAFDNTPNRGVVDDRRGEIRLAGAPNAFYARGGAVLVPPTLYLSVPSASSAHKGAAGGASARREEYTVKLGCGLRNKVLNFPRIRSRLGPLFYGNSDALPIRSQEAILVDGSAAADRSAFDFWGLRPAR